MEQLIIDYDMRYARRVLSFIQADVYAICENYPDLPAVHSKPATTAA